MSSVPGYNARDQGAIGRQLRKAVALYRCGDLSPAAEVCKQILRIEPGHHEALDLLGAVQLRLKDPAGALAYFERALLQKPDSAECLTSRGTALRDLQRYDEALTSYEAALVCRPDFPAAHNNKGLTLLYAGRPDEALASLRRALELREDYPMAWSNLALTLHHLRRDEEALTSATRALHVGGEAAEFLVTRATILMGLGNQEAAERDLRRALELRPDSSTALSTLSTVQCRRGQPDRASETLARLLEVKPDWHYVHGDLINARSCCCDWSHSAEDIARALALLSAGQRSIRPFHLLSVSDSASLQLTCARLFAEATVPATAPPPLWAGRRYGHTKIRLAYISPDFRDHAVSYLMAGVFEHHDRERFETLGVSLGGPHRGAMAERIRLAFDELVEAGTRSDREIAALLLEHEIDIAVDLQGFTEKPRTFMAHRPAPVQVNYVGFPGTLGSSHYDYIIADDFVIPPERLGDYAEKVVYLPECFQPNDDRKPARVDPPPRGELGLPETGVVFAAFNNCHKLTPAMFDIWMRLLAKTPGSVLWMLGDLSNVRHNLRREAARRGIAPERLVFANRQAYSSYLLHLGSADLFLDTFPFNGGATASDALWAGVPMVTCAGEAFAARMAGSLLRSVGLPELVTHSLSEYETVALSLAQNPAARFTLRARLANNCRSMPLFNTARLCRSLESAYTAMWRCAERGELPRHFAVQLE